MASESLLTALMGLELAMSILSKQKLKMGQSLA